MAKYRLAPNEMVVRNEDEAWIPPDPGNGDRQEYEAWLAEGNTPDPLPPDLSTTLDMGQPMSKIMGG